MDAYRAAFEEQLYRNKQMMLQLAEIAVAGPSKYEKAKVILKNLIHLLNDGKWKQHRIDYYFFLSFIGSQTLAAIMQPLPIFFFGGGGEAPKINR